MTEITLDLIHYSNQSTLCMPEDEVNVYSILGIYNFERAIKSVICMQLCDFFSQLSTTEVEHSALQLVAQHIQLFTTKGYIKSLKILAISCSLQNQDTVSNLITI